MSENKELTIVALSDTHGHTPDIPDGDILIYAGDFSPGFGAGRHVKAFKEWMQNLPHQHKLVIAGNHDIFMERQPEAILCPELYYLQDTAITVEGIKFYGSPYTPMWRPWAFRLETPDEATAKWARIPEDTDVLITHGPPRDILDRCPDGRRVGCPALRERVDKIWPKLHIFGHIHCEYGIAMDRFYNVSICNEAYEAVNSVTVIKYKKV